jgi:hypothetical protein
VRPCSRATLGQALAVAAARCSGRNRACRGRGGRCGRGAASIAWAWAGSELTMTPSKSKTTARTGMSWECRGTLPAHATRVSFR